MKVIITGGCGFIGGALIRKLLKTSEHEILNIDKFKEQTYDEIAKSVLTPFVISTATKPAFAPYGEVNVDKPVTAL